MVDKGIEVILNSTVWTEATHSGAYNFMKERLGLAAGDNKDIGMIINTSMSPWLRAQITYKRLGIIIRNELYNAHGAVYDEPVQLRLVSPCCVGSTKDWKGNVFAELEVRQSLEPEPLLSMCTLIDPSIINLLIFRLHFPLKASNITPLGCSLFPRETLTRLKPSQ